MCGFVAFVGRSGSVPSSPATISRMLAVITHRGPDDRGTYFAENVGFGFRRLAILDVSPAGHQPMSSVDGQVTVVFNGEIYNYLELRTQLSARGHRFVSDSDTEVLLHAYVEWGDDCITRFNGMWAFLIHDRGRKRVFGSRDRFGMKPLYVHEAPDGILLASEIKSIRNSGHYADAVDLQVCARFFLEAQLDDTDATFFAGIRSISPGCCIEIDAQGVLRSWRYWQLPTSRDALGEPADGYAELFEDAVGIHMRSDVPLGVNLSGGMDSTAILCAIARHRRSSGNPLPLQAFSFAAPEYDESAYIDATLAQTGARREALTLGPKAFWESLSTVLWYQDEPVHSITAVVGFHLSGLAARHGVKVILNGQGADETLAGYPSYFRDYWYSLLTAGRPATIAREIAAFSRMHGGSPAALGARLLKHAVQTELRRNTTYRRLSRRRQLERYTLNDWFEPELAQALPRVADFEDASLDATLTRAIQREPLPLYLRVEDRNAMAHSVEARLPFLDPRLVEFAFRLQPEWKMRGPWNKFILREAMRGLIPEVVRTRPDKMGFPTPFAKWLRNELYDAARSIIEDRSFADSGPFRVAAIRRDLERHRKGEIDVAARLFDVIQFHLWRQLDPSVVPSHRAPKFVEEVAA